MKGKIIVIEGTDGSGKKTQTELLVKQLKREGKKVATLDFPRYYHNLFGALVARYLRGEFGSLKQVSPYLASVLYAGDRLESKPQIEQWLKAGRIIVLDRYYTANQIHQASKFKTAKEKKAFLNWLNRLEFKIFNIPRADLVIFLDLPPNFNRILLRGKQAAYKRKAKDLHESDQSHLQAAYREALRCWRREKNWRRIKCYQGKKILTREKIHQLIIEQVKNVT